MTHWMHIYPERVRRGLSHPCSKLTPEQVAELRELAERWGPSRLAAYYGVSRQTIWRHLRNVTRNVSR